MIGAFDTFTKKCLICRPKGTAMNAKAAEKRIAQTQQWLKDALLSLMKTKPYGEIKINDIAEAADVARCTFYRHFDTKEALLMECCRDQFDGLYLRLSKENIYTFHGAGLGYFDYWADHREFLELLKRNNLLYFFSQNHALFMYDVSMRLKPENIREDYSEYSTKAVYHFFCGMSAMFGILSHWLNTGCRETPEELAQFYVSFIAEGYETDVDCQYYQEHHAYPYDPCYIQPGI